MKPRLLILLILLAVVVGTTIWRGVNPRRQTQVFRDQTSVRPAPLFQLLDQNSRPVQLNGYLSRYPILLCFFDAATGPDADPVLQQLKQSYPALKRLGIIVFAVSSPLGPDQKSSAMSFPFPVLRDTLAGQPGSCCVLWGRMKLQDGSTAPVQMQVQVQPAMFLIEANGMVAWEGDAPKPVADPQQLISDLIGGNPSGSE
jgi:peroxiredoxin